MAEKDSGSPQSGNPPKLLDRLRNVIRARRYSPRTEEAYVYWVRKFIIFHGKRHPDTMAEHELNQFLTHLAVEHQCAAATQNQALCAILFLYEHVLHRPLGNLSLVIRAKRPKRIPAVLSRQEVRDVLAHVRGVSRFVADLLYGSAYGPKTPNEVKAAGDYRLKCATALKTRRASSVQAGIFTTTAHLCRSAGRVRAQKRQWL